MIELQIDIGKPLAGQFAAGLGMEQGGVEMFLGSAAGTGEPMRVLALPGKLEFYHFGKARFAVPIRMTSVNAPGSEWFLIHVNLSKTAQRKSVDGKTLDFQARLPIGILIYGPGLEIDTLIPPNVDSELASIRFNRSFLDTYFEDLGRIFDTRKNLICEDLDYLLRDRLDRALESMGNKMLCHANVLQFMNELFVKLASHYQDRSGGRLRSSEIDSLFAAVAHLRDPLATSVPTIEELAGISNMSVTKFKNAFRQLFGSAPIQYRNRIRMEYAREEIAAKRRTPSEISYLLGYSHPSNFTSAYKKFFRELPSAPRKK